MKVKTIHDHSNVFGEQYRKASGESYDLPDAHAAALIESGIAVAVEEAAPVEETATLVDEPKPKK